MIDHSEHLYFKHKPKVAFICVHNSCRSQMAEALGKARASATLECYSAGTQLKDHINPDAVRIVQERYGIDMEISHKPKLLSALPPIDILIYIGCNVSCPYVAHSYEENWHLDDPSGQEDAAFHRVLDAIEAKLQALQDKIVIQP